MASTQQPNPGVGLTLSGPRIATPFPSCSPGPAACAPSPQSLSRNSGVGLAMTGQRIAHPPRSASPAPHAYTPCHNPVKGTDFFAPTDRDKRANAALSARYT